MNRYECEKCLRIFTRNESLLYHITKKVCMPVQNNDQYYGNHVCKYCRKVFTTATNAYRHMNHACRIKKNEDSKRDEIYEKLLELKKENKVLKKEVNSLKKNVIKPSKITNNINTINNGIVAHINLIGYGKEDLSKIDKKDILKVIQNGFDSALKLTETLHFNPKHPEYHNVYITNIKDKYAMMFDGKDWNLTMKNDLINKIYDDKKNYIEENLDEFIDSLSLSRKKALERWLTTDNDDDKIIKVKNEIKLLLYNKRNLITDKQDNIEMGSKKTIKAVTMITKKY